MTVALAAFVAGALVGAAWARRRWRRVVAAFVDATRSTPGGAVPPAAAGGDLAVLLAALEQARRECREEAHRAWEEVQRLTQILEHLADGVLVIDPNGDVRLANRRARELLGVGAEIAQGRPLVDLVRIPEVLQIAASARHATPPEEAPPARSRVQLPQGATVEVTASVARTGEGDPGEAILVLHDISELEAASRIRRDFVADVSHELRTPLAAIRGYSETLLDGALERGPEARRFAAIIHRHAERLARLVDDLLVLSDLESGRSPLRRRRIDARELVSRAVETLAGTAAAREVRLETTAAGGPFLLEADPDRIEQALINVLDNAIRYSPEGGTVSVRVAAAPCPDEAVAAPWVEICTRDCGPGIPAEQIARVTERFYRVDRARSRRAGGAGLGLAIVKHVVELHGGRLRIESARGQGTTVRILLPPPTDAPAAPGGPTPAVR